MISYLVFCWSPTEFLVPIFLIESLFCWSLTSIISVEVLHIHISFRWSPTCILHVAHSLKSCLYPICVSLKPCNRVESVESYIIVHYILGWIPHVLIGFCTLVEFYTLYSEFMFELNPTCPTGFVHFSWILHIHITNWVESYVFICVESYTYEDCWVLQHDRLLNPTCSFCSWILRIWLLLNPTHIISVGTADIPK